MYLKSNTNHSRFVAEPYDHYVVTLETGCQTPAT